MPTHVALLRGINVGGKNLIPMADLKHCLEDAGFKDVATLIASGNIVFTPPPKIGTSATLTKKIESLIRARFKTYEAKVVVLTRKQLHNIVIRAPKGFGKDPKKYRYMVFFLRPPLKSATVIKKIPLKEGVDEIFAGPSVLYHTRLEKKATSSRLSQLVSMPIYQEMTLRNWSTTTKLLSMLQTTPGQ